MEWQSNILRKFNKHIFLLLNYSFSSERHKLTKNYSVHFRARVEGSCELLVNVSGSTEWKAKNIAKNITNIFWQPRNLIN